MKQHTHISKTEFVTAFLDVNMSDFDLYILKKYLFIPLLVLCIPIKGRECNPPPCSRHLGQVVYGCVTLWRQRVAQLPIPPPLLASWEIADRLPNQTICPTRDCWNVLTEIAGQPGTDFSHRGERSTLYTVYITLYKHLAGSFWVLRQNLQQVAPNQEKPHTIPYYFLI